MKNIMSLNPRDLTQGGQVARISEIQICLISAEEICKVKKITVIFLIITTEKIPASC